ncbi:unnamed protein product [Gadus morhua 'NCC']
MAPGVLWPLASGSGAGAVWLAQWHFTPDTGAVSGEGVLAMVLIWLAAVRQCVGVIVGARRRSLHAPPYTAPLPRVRSTLHTSPRVPSASTGAAPAAPGAWNAFAAFLEHVL